MGANPILGVFFHWLGGFASGSFYVPFKAVKTWSWEVYWLLGGVFSWIIAPWVLGLIIVPHLTQVLGQQPISVLGWTFFWGVLWGFGGLTYGLTMRYLGLSLGTGIILGLTAVFGTYLPPIFDGTIGAKLQTVAGHVILIGSVFAVMGIALTAAAGLSKEREMDEEQKRKAIREFNLRKGILVAIFSGVMSSCFAFGLDSAAPIAATALHYGAAEIWTGLPKIIVITAGGFVTNLVWCLYLLKKNRTFGEYFGRSTPVPENSAVELAGNSVAAIVPAERARLLTNYLFSALAGTTWYFQFFFYTMGESQMGKYQFSSWTIHMASIIIFGSLWGIFLKEWKDTSGLSKFLLGVALFTLIASTIVIGYGNLLGIQLGGH
ncbi:MAG: rhamnose/proton symporter RhaT [Ignavibacteriae bacterium 37-53-5]|nr:MAG: rhamnose/proton symporter RhaT [Ignavibacteriae bacterium 37-53-5]